MVDSDSNSAFWSWVAENKEWFREVMLAHGAILLRGAPIQKPEDFERFVDEAGFPRMPYVGGAAPRKEVTSRVLTPTSPHPVSPFLFITKWHKFRILLRISLL